MGRHMGFCLDCCVERLICEFVISIPFYVYMLLKHYCTEKPTDDDTEDDETQGTDSYSLV